MQLGMIGLGRMGANMARRLQRAGHTCVGYDRDPGAAGALAGDGVRAAASLEELVAALEVPRAVCIMVPAAVVDATIAALEPLLAAGDTIVDGGNSHYHDDIARAERLASLGIAYVDMGTSGGVWGLERGYCLMIGGEDAAVRRLEPIFAALAPGSGNVEPVQRSGAASGTAPLGYLHCGPPGAGHFVKMVHNGIEYGLMAAYAEGLNLLHRANVGRADREADAETAPLRERSHYQYDFDLAAITELWRRGSVITSWLLDLTAAALAGDPALEQFQGRVSDSGEGRWAVQAAIDAGVPAHVLTAALYERFGSRGEDRFQNRVVSAMRAGFGGHQERPRER
jgi:6-phosphogluconate dehydrogenase